MHVLGNMVKAVRPSGTLLDLQVIRPNPRVETGNEFVCEVDGEWLFDRADAARSAVDDLILSGCLSEEAIDDHDVRKHYRNGADLVDNFKDKQRNLPLQAIPKLLAIKQSCLVRERCRLRRLRVQDSLARA